MSNIEATISNVPSVNSTANVGMRDVIGNKGDWSAPITNDSSILAYLKAGYYHAHGDTIKFPLISSGELFKTITSSATALTHGAKVELIPADAIATAFDIHWIEITAMSAQAEYEITVWAGADTEEEALTSVVVASSANFSREGSKAIMIPQQPANTRISISIAKSSAGTGTMRVALEGHTYGNGE